MFDPKHQQINEHYLQTVAAGASAADALGKMIYEVYEKLRSILKEREKKVALEIGKDTYNLVPDESTPGAYKWEKVDLTQGAGVEKVNDQASAIARKVIETVPDLDDNSSDLDYEPAMRIVAYSEQNEPEVIYAQDTQGKCRQNLILAHLSQDEIIEVAYEPMKKLLPPDHRIIEKYEFHRPFLEGSSEDVDINTLTPEDVPPSDETVSFIEDVDINTLTPEDVPPLDETVSFIEDVDINTLTPEELTPLEEVHGSNIIATTSTKQSSEPLLPKIPRHNLDEVDYWEPDLNLNQNLHSETTTTKKQSSEAVLPKIPRHNTSQNAHSETPVFFNNSQPEEETTIPKQQNRTLKEPPEQQWVKQAEIPIIQHTKERYNGENKDIAETATAMLKKYSTIEQDGSRIYRSDAFAIRQVGNTISIHRRSDELSGWSNSLMEFQLNKKEEPKITKLPTKMLAVERQEFLVVAQTLHDNGKLLDLNSADIRDVANSLGSLAPSGTIKTLEVFKQNELLLTLNNLLVQTNREELAVGEFTIKRSRDSENHASLQLLKSTEEKGTQELVRFDLTKTEDGITKEVSRINISDYDINRVKFIVQNAQKLNLEQVFGQREPQNQTTPRFEQPIQTAGDIPVKVHPYIAKFGNEAMNEQIKNHDGKLSIAQQRVMYFEILEQAQNTGGQVANYVPLQNMMNDLQQWRGEQIKQQYTPTEHIPYQQQAVAGTNPKSTGLEI